MRGRTANAIAITVGILLTLLALLPLWPSAQAAVSTLPVLAHLIAFPALLALIGLLTLALVLLPRFARSQTESDSNYPRRSYKGANIAIGVLLVPSTLVLLTLPDLVVPTPTPPVMATAPATDRVDSTPDAGSRTGMNSEGTPSATGKPRIEQLRVLSWNAENQVGDEQMQQVVGLQPDVIVMPEAQIDNSLWGTKIGQMTDFGSALVANYRVFHLSNGYMPDTIVMIHRSLGNFEPAQHPQTTFGAVAVRPTRDNDLRTPAGERLPTIIGVHTAPPLPGLMSEWVSDLRQLVATDDVLGAPGQSLILAGDFNATLRHGELARLQHLRDAKHSVLGPRPSGTWPSWMSPTVSSPIDHIFTNTAQPVEFQTVRIGSSDHRAIFATLKLR